MTIFFLDFLLDKSKVFVILVTKIFRLKILFGDIWQFFLIFFSNLRYCSKGKIDILKNNVLLFLFILKMQIFNNGQKYSNY